MTISPDSWAVRQAEVYRWRRWFMRDILLRYLGFTLIVKLHVEGQNHIPLDEPVIFMMNHTIAIDGVVVLGVLRQRDVIPIIKAESLDDPYLKIFTRNWGVIGVHRGEVDRAALKTILELLELKHAILMAPEGTRQPALLRPKDGLTYLALKANPLIVPVAVWNGEKWLENFFRRRTEMYVQFGQPFRLKAAGQRVSREDMSLITDEMMYQLAVLLPEHYRGEYRDLTQMTTQHLSFESKTT